MERGRQNQRLAEAKAWRQAIMMQMFFLPQEMSYLMIAVTLKVVKSCTGIAHTSVVLQVFLITSNMKWNCS